MNKQTEILIANLKRLMYEQRITQGDIATGLGIAQSSVSDWLTGKSFPRMNKLNDLAAFFHVDPIELLTKPESLPQNTDNSPNQAITEQYTKEEQLLVMKFRCLNESQKSLVRNMLGMFLDN